MDAISSRRTDRDTVLTALYSLTGGSLQTTVRYSDVSKHTALGAEAVKLAVEFLVERDLARFVTMGPTIAITTDGIERAEELLAPLRIDLETLLLPLSVEEQRGMEALLRQAADVLDSATDVNPETRAAVQADLDTAQTQLRSPRPSRVVLGMILRHAVAVGEGVLGSVIASQFLAF